MTGTGFDWSALPSRRVLIGSLVGALASGSLLGLVLGVLAPAPTGAGQVVAAAADGPTSATATATPTAAAGPSPSKSKTQTITTVTKSPAAAPDAFIQRPERDRTMFLATLEALNQSDPNHILIYLRPADLLRGAKAKQWWQSQGQPQRDVAAVPRDGAQTQELVLSRDAALWGQVVLGGDGQNVNLRRLGIDEFLNAANGILSQNQHPPVWIKRTLGVTGDVIYLAEQAIPQPAQQ